MTMRRITIGAGSSAPAKKETDSAADVFAKVANGLESLDDLTDRLSELEAEHKSIYDALERVEKSLGEIKAVSGKLSSYMTEHAELHRNMAKERGSAVEDLIKLARNSAGQVTVVQDTIADALSKMAQRRDVPVVLDTKVSAPAVNVTVQQPAKEAEDENQTYTFDVKRGQNGLIREVVGRPGVPRNEQN